MATAQNGYIWFGGDFTDVGPTAERVAYYDPANDSVSIPNDGVASGSVYAMVIDDQGRIWIGGSFTSVGGITCNNIALYDGQGWLKLGDGLDSTCYALQFENGIIYAGGAFTTAGDLNLLDGLAIWNGYTWAYLDCDLPSTSTVNAILILNDDYYLGFNQSGTAITAQDQTLVNDGTREAFPKIVIERSGGTALGVKYIKNETTGAILYLNYDLLDGERLTIDTTEGSRSVKSSYFGSVWRALLRSSDFSIFSLFPGSNVISVLITESGTPTITAYMQWVIKHWSSDGVAN
jgi:hypothetical protein